MKRIGVDQSTHDLYESVADSWHPVWPSAPVLSVAAFVAPEENAPTLNELDRAEMVFREDSFDAVTRIRRGRFYGSSSDLRPSTKFTLLHPVYGDAGSNSVQVGSKYCERSLFVFDQLQGRPSQHIVAIGSGDSLWRILGAERIVTGEYLVTLKARHALGVLPELNADAVPERGRQKAIELFEKLVDSAYRESPVSVVDNAKDAAQWCLATWAAHKWSDESLFEKELGPLISCVEAKGKEKPKIILSTSHILARLHPRRKPNEQERLSLRPLIEADAEFALAAMGLLLREFGWVL